MNVSHAWLRDFVPFEHDALALRDLLTSHTVTVDEVVPLRADLAPFVVARVVESTPIPETRLSYNKVDAGGGALLDVVCGAPNVTVGKLYPFAPSGTTMPASGSKAGLTLERRKIRGFSSNGMLCSASELGLGEESDGIWELDVDVAPGTPLVQAIPASDVRLVLDVTANRPDLLSHRGVAREIAAVTGLPLALPAFEGDAVPIATPRRAEAAGESAGIRVQVDEGAALARRYMGVVIRGVTVGPSPAWLVDRLSAVGARSVNNVVDATNYVLWEIGQPTHAFDLAKLEGQAVVVRRAREGETLVTLDGVSRTLTPDVTVIADTARPVAIAGVMGGLDSEVTAETRDLFLEIASFDPARIRSSRKLLGVSTDASYRFERGVDPELAADALVRCTRLILALAGGALGGAPVDAYVQAPTPRSIPLRESRIAQVLGVAVPFDRSARALRTLGCAVKPSGASALEVVPPTWRSDLNEEIDLVEEVARLVGYDTFPAELRAGRPSAASDDPHWVVADQVRTALVAAGLYEVQPLPFVAGGDGYVRVTNPLAENESCLRREVLETLARRAEHNLAHMQGDVRLFEIGSVFRPSAGSLPVEELRVGLLVMGERDPAHFTQSAPAPFDLWDAKALAEMAARAAFGLRAVDVRPAADEADGRLWDVVVDENVVGEVRRVVLDAPVWATDAFGVELSLGVIESAPVAPEGEHANEASVTRGVTHVRARPFRPLPVAPATEFDLALLVADARPVGEVEGAIRRAAGDLLESVRIFDVYTGTGVPEGFRSVAFRLVLRHPERTLRDKEIDGRRAKILSTLEKELDVRQRAT